MEEVFTNAIQCLSEARQTSQDAQTSCVVQCWTSVTHCDDPLRFNDKRSYVLAGNMTGTTFSMQEDRGLEPIGHFLPILKRGIAVHHSGLLPLLKELVELLFQEGLIKAKPSTDP